MMSFLRTQAGLSKVKYKGVIAISLGVAFGLVAGWVLFPMVLYSSEMQPVLFSHKIHTGESAGLACESCHDFSADGRFVGIPPLEKCAECHSSQIGTDRAEKVLVEEFIVPRKQIPWKVYSRQPDNAYFSHAEHVKLAGLACGECHAPREAEDVPPIYRVNRISGYSRDIWGSNISGLPSKPWEGMKMNRCVRCHAERGKKDGCIECHK
jgi:hypothetical protein